MYCLTVSYPKSEDSKFDQDYYENSHLAMVKEKLGPLGLQRVVLRKNVGAKPGRGESYYASVDLVFENAGTMGKALADEGGAINADIVNYTNVKAEFGFSEIEFS